jgi:hypothetical protein
MLQGRAMWSIESCLCLPIPVTRLPKPGVLHSTPLSLVVSRCSQHVPCRNSSSVLVSCTPLERLLCAPQCSSSSIAEEFPVHRNLGDGESNAQMPTSALRSFHASALRLKKCASQSAKGFGRLQFKPRPKPALTQLCH